MELSQNNEIITSYINGKEELPIEHYLPDYNLLKNSLSKIKSNWEKGRVLELGSGTGWLQIICAQNNINCEGVEISKQLVDYSMKFAKKYNVMPNINLGNIENYDMGEDKYDVIIACSVFEHVENWQGALSRVYKALKKDGVFYFISTNKFSILSGEFKFIPLYGLLPDAIRYKLRSFFEGGDVMKLGIDFNQFSYPQLTREFKKIGFDRVENVVDFMNPNDADKTWKKKMIRLAKKNFVLRKMILTFCSVTFFLCKK